MQQNCPWSGLLKRRSAARAGVAKTRRCSLRTVRRTPYTPGMTTTLTRAGISLLLTSPACLLGGDLGDTLPHTSSCPLLHRRKPWEPKCLHSSLSPQLQTFPLGTQSPNPHPAWPLCYPGLQVLLVFTKGCTQEEDQEALVTQHQAGPGLSIVSYTCVCRHEDFCNDLSSTPPLRTLHSPEGETGERGGGGEKRGCGEEGSTEAVFA